MADEREERLNNGLNGVETPPAEEPAEQAEQEQPAEEEVPEGEDQEQEVDQDAEPEEEHAAAPEKPESRAQRRIRSLSDAKSRAEAEAQLSRELAERYRREAEQAAAERRSREDETLDPDIRWRRDMEGRARAAEVAAFDAGDRAAFYSMAAADSARAKYKDRVETELQKARSAGQMASREGIYVYLRGQDAIAAETRSGAARQKSAEKVRQERGKHAMPTGNAQPSRVKSLEDRLKDIAI